MSRRALVGVRRIGRPARRWLDFLLKANHFAFDAGPIRLIYKAMILIRTEPMLADLCRDCGTIVSLHVRNLERKWRTKAK